MVLAKHSRRTGLKSAALSAVEMLEEAKRSRQLTHEEEKILTNLQKALFGGVRHLKEDSRVLEGIYDGKNMIGSDGNVYEVPANYASKSKMVEGDKLRLNIDKEGVLTYKQIGPVERQKKKGVLGEQDDGELRVIADGHAYKISPATLLYFGAEPGDQVGLKNKKIAVKAIF